MQEATRLEGAGALPEAIAVYERLLAQTPMLPDCWYNLALLQRKAGRYAAALGSYAQALAHGVDDPAEVYLNRAVIYADCLHDAAAAQRELEAALALSPRYLPALQNLANLHEDLGRRAEARAVYERILSVSPGSAIGLARYAQASEVSGPDDPLIARLRAALGAPTARAADRASLGFALARVLDACGQYAEAFAAAQAANTASRLSVTPTPRYDRAAHEGLIGALIQAFPLAPASAGLAGGALRPTPEPIFICGMFRSGSTLTERLLSAHPQLAAGGELDLLPRLVQARLMPFPAAMAQVPPAALARLADEYLAGLRQVFPQAGWVTDKRPDNFLLIGLMRALFPGVRIVHTTRDALDTCLSIFFLHLDQRLSYALDLMDIGHYFRQYRRLMRHWQALCGEQLLEFNYDSLVRDPRPAAERLLGFCGLPWEESVLSFAGRPASVRTASVWQVREPLYRHASGRARHYARELAALAAYLAEPD